MPYQNNIITKPINISDIKKALRTSENDLGALATHQNINKWAKNKPIKYSKLFSITADERMKLGYGLKPYTFQGSFSAFAADVLNKMATVPGFVDDLGITYEKPTGGEQSPYRMGDFDEYKHDAKLQLDVPLKNGGWLSLNPTKNGDTIDAESGVEQEIGNPNFGDLNNTDIDRDNATYTKYNANIFDVMASGVFGSLNFSVIGLANKNHYVFVADAYYGNPKLCQGSIDWDKVLQGFDMPGGRVVEIPIIDFWTDNPINNLTEGGHNFYVYHMGMQKIRTDFLVNIQYYTTPSGGAEFWINLNGDINFSDLYYPTMWVSFYKNGVHDIVPLGREWTPDSNTGGVRITSTGKQFYYELSAQLFDNYDGTPYIHFYCAKNSGSQGSWNVRKRYDYEGYRQ